MTHEECDSLNVFGDLLQIRGFDANEFVSATGAFPALQEVSAVQTNRLVRRYRGCKRYRCSSFRWIQYRIWDTWHQESSMLLVWKASLQANYKLHETRFAQDPRCITYSAGDNRRIQSPGDIYTRDRCTCQNVRMAADRCRQKRQWYCCSYPVGHTRLSLICKPLWNDLITS